MTAHDDVTTSTLAIAVMALFSLGALAASISMGWQ